MASFFESKELSISIFSLWRELLAEENLPPLDRWLKSRSKPLIAKKGKSRQAPPQPLVISAALMDGMRFMQLACWLEYQ